MIKLSNSISDKFTLESKTEDKFSVESKETILIQTLELISVNPKASAIVNIALYNSEEAEFISRVSVIENFNPKDKNEKTNPDDLVISFKQERIFPKDIAIPGTADINRFPLAIVPKGMTKREYFAAKALQGLCTIDYISLNDKASIAVTLSDLLIEKLNKE